jgi:hypothetical protein
VLKDLPEIPDMRVRFGCGRFLFEAFDCYISLFYVGLVQQASVFWGSRPICGVLANYEQVWSAHAKKRTSKIQVHRFFWATQSSYPLVNKQFANWKIHHFSWVNPLFQLGHVP